MLIRVCSKCGRFLGLKLYRGEGLGSVVKNITTWEKTSGICPSCYLQIVKKRYNITVDNKKIIYEKDKKK